MENPKRNLNFCKGNKKIHCLDRTKCMLGYVSRACNTNIYMIDFHKEQIIVGNLTGRTVAGFPTEVVRKEGLKIYDKILSKNENEWMQKMHSEANKIVSIYDDFETRMELVFSYDLLAKAPNRKEITLHHRIIPYQLDDDGNVWLALCTVSALPLTHKATKACIDCVKTGERYDYVDNKFVLSQYKHLTEEEIIILGLLADGVAIKQISAKVDLSLRVVERKKKEALDKLGAPTQAAAVYRAKVMGLI